MAFETQLNALEAIRAGRTLLDRALGNPKLSGERLGSFLCRRKARVLLPYCVESVGNDLWIVLNHNSQPIGTPHSAPGRRHDQPEAFVVASEGEFRWFIHRPPRFYLYQNGPFWLGSPWDGRVALRS